MVDAPELTRIFNAGIGGDGEVEDGTDGGQSTTALWNSSGTATPGGPGLGRQRLPLPEHPDACHPDEPAEPGGRPPRARASSLPWFR